LVRKETVENRTFSFNLRTVDDQKLWRGEEKRKGGGKSLQRECGKRTKPFPHEGAPPKKALSQGVLYIGGKNENREKTCSEVSKGRPQKPEAGHTVGGGTSE